MKSIKPGRGPSKQSYVASVFGIIFGVFWTILAATITSGAGLIGIIFPLFGICFIGMGIYNAYIAYHNAHGKDRMSLFDIVDSDAEADPWSPNYKEHRKEQDKAAETQKARFCPYCGKPIEEDYKFCKYCGRSLI